MKFAGLISLGLFSYSGAATTVSVGTCEELQQAVDATSTDDITAELSNGGVSCDAWTSFEITANRLKLVAPAATGYSGQDVFVFNNVRFVVSNGGTLRSLPKVEFTGGDDSQQQNGGVLNIAEGGRARFKSSAYMHDVKLLSLTDGSPSLSGGCIYNKGLLRFDDGFEASHCSTDSLGEDAPGDGSGIWNGETGVVVMKGDVNIADCGFRENEGNKGGALYNAGKFSVFDDATFTDNQGSAGGAIYNIGLLKFLKKSVPEFSGNRANSVGGGHVHNTSSGRMLFNGGALFSEGFTEDNGGAIWNDANLSISKSAEFRNNRANGDGGAIYNLATSNLVLPSYMLFQGNTAPSTFGDCDNIYSYTEDFEFECLP